MKKFYQRPDGSVYTVTDDVRQQDFVPARTGAAPLQEPKQRGTP
jgi:hypothetical protein